MENSPNGENQIFQREQISPAETRYKEAYEKSLELWEKPYQSSMVETRFGKTHVLENGSKEDKPLILLPGMSASATLWYPNIAELSRNRRILALDVPGDAGLSEAEQAPKDRREYAQWLIEVLNHYQIDKADIAGISYGGYLSLNFAALAPTRVRKLVLLAPSGWLKLKTEFRSNMYQAWFLRTRGKFNKFITSMSKREDVINDPVVEQIYTNFRYLHRRPKALPEILSESELRAIKTPTLFLVGESEVIYSPTAGIEQAKLIEGAHAEIVPGAGHLLSFDQPRAVNARIVRFLE